MLQGALLGACEGATSALNRKLDPFEIEKIDADLKTTKSFAGETDSDRMRSASATSLALQSERSNDFENCFINETFGPFERVGLELGQKQSRSSRKEIESFRRAERFARVRASVHGLATARALAAPKLLPSCFASTTWEAFRDRKGRKVLRAPRAGESAACVSFERSLRFSCDGPCGGEVPPRPRERKFGESEGKGEIEGESGGRSEGKRGKVRAPQATR